MSYKPKVPSVMASPNVIPMADIMLVPLIIFMVITPMLHTGPPVDIATAESADDMPGADRDDAVILAVTRDGSLFLSPGSKKIGLEAITSDIQDLVASRPDKTVYVRSDARARYGQVAKAVDAVRAAGVDRIGLLTERIQTKRAPHALPASSD
jgi:biopolymer transport protein ExbD